MLGIIVVTHSNLAKGLRDAVEMIDGPQECFDVLGFYEGDSLSALGEAIRAAAKKYEAQGEGYVVVTDMYGATPFNAALTGLSSRDTGVLTGVNLSMILELVTQRQSCRDYRRLLEAVVDSAVQNTRSVMVRDVFAAGGAKG